MGHKTLIKTHELTWLKSGEATLRHLDSGELMHSNVGPKAESSLLYVEQSKLADRLCEPSKHPLVVYDVGLGAGTNALAALQCSREIRQETWFPRKLRLYSFESDLSGIAIALENHSQFPFFEGFEGAVAALLEKGSWSSSDEATEWVLKEGDFRQSISDLPQPELVYFDFYSPKVTPDLWSVEIFGRVYQKCTQTSSLFTYSASTRVRVALLLAGFFVGYGRSTGAKRETTVASTSLATLERPLDARWLARFKNSHEPIPYGWPGEKRGEVFEKVLNHKQFQGSAFRPLD
ncbi:MAG: MnmC family methyltransferase [Bdellovibrionota bacterium]